jgi:uncharacterized protein YndB with AHSA1/START domain
VLPLLSAARPEPAAAHTTAWHGRAPEADQSVVACFDKKVTPLYESEYVVTASRDIAATAAEIFELIADPSQQPRWDGNDNLSEAPSGQRVHAVGDVFIMTLTAGSVRQNHVVEFVEQRRIAWRPSEPGQPAAGHLWRWILEPIDASHTRVTHTYDWTQLTDDKRIPRARATTAEKLRASLDRLAELAEHR